MKKHDLPAMPFYFGDWRKAPEVRALEPDVRMFWFEMLGYMWESTDRGYLTLNGKAIEERALATMLGIDTVRLTDALSTMDNLGVFSRREGDAAIYCRRMVKEEARRVQNRINGSKGGNPKLSDKGLVVKSVNRKHNQSTEDEDESEGENKGRFKGRDTDPFFTTFWKAYPKKESKEAAWKMWKKMPAPASTVRKILTALEWQKKSEQWLKENGQFIPLPATYLNAAKWEDQPTKVVAGPGPNPLGKL